MVTSLSLLCPYPGLCLCAYHLSDWKSSFLAQGFCVAFFLGWWFVGYPLHEVVGFLFVLVWCLVELCLRFVVYRFFLHMKLKYQKNVEYVQCIVSHYSIAALACLLYPEK